jgi:hypothetical protein
MSTVLNPTESAGSPETHTDPTATPAPADVIRKLTLIQELIAELHDHSAILRGGEPGTMEVQVPADDIDLREFSVKNREDERGTSRLEQILSEVLAQRDAVGKLCEQITAQRRQITESSEQALNSAREQLRGEMADREREIEEARTRLAEERQELELDWEQFLAERAELSLLRTEFESERETVDGFRLEIEQQRQEFEAWEQELRGRAAAAQDLIEVAKRERDLARSLKRENAAAQQQIVAALAALEAERAAVGAKYESIAAQFELLQRQEGKLSEWRASFDDARDDSNSRREEGGRRKAESSALSDLRSPTSDLRLPDPVATDDDDDEMPDTGLTSARYLKSWFREPAGPEPPRAPRPEVAAADEPPASADDEEAELPKTIAAYMERLLNRKSEAATSNRAHDMVGDNPAAPDQTLRPRTVADANSIRADMDSMREIANFTARKAIARSTWNRFRGSRMTKAVLVILADLLFLGLITSDSWLDYDLSQFAWPALAIAMITTLEFGRQIFQQKRLLRDAAAGSGDAGVRG